MNLEASRSNDGVSMSSKSGKGAGHHSEPKPHTHVHQPAGAEGAGPPPPHEPARKEEPSAHQPAVAELSGRDGRSLSTLARIGLLAGACLLILTVLIGMVPWLSYSLILQDDLIRRILFCVSLGLILAALGDYAFYQANKLFTVGGATAIALIIFYALSTQTVEPVSSARVRIDSNANVKAVYLMPRDGEYRATVDPKYESIKIFQFRFPLSVAERITEQCFEIEVDTTDGSHHRFSIQGADAGLPQAAAYVFDFKFDIATSSLTRTTKRGVPEQLPKCTGVVQDIPPPQKEVPAGGSGSATSPRTGWTIYGRLGDSTGEWAQRVYDNKSRAANAEPKKDDEAEVITDVYLRVEPRKCRPDGECDKLSQDLGVLKIGDRVHVLDVIPVGQSYIWVRVEAKVAH